MSETFPGFEVRPAAPAGGPEAAPGIPVFGFDPSGIALGDGHGGPDGDPVPPPLRPPPGRMSLRQKLRLGAAFAFLVSLTVHGTLLALFVGGTAPGLPDGQEGIAVDVITQQQYDLMVGEGSSQGGRPRRVEDSGSGSEASQHSPLPSPAVRSESEAEQRQAMRVIGSDLAPEAVPSGTADRVNDASAAASRRSDAKTQAQGSPNESAAARRTEPKERPDSDREDARNPSAPVKARPGAEGGEQRREAARGGVGDENGPLPPSMRQALMQQLQKQIEPCFAPPAGFDRSDELPLIQIRFHRDGSLDGQPRSWRYERTAAGKAMVKAALKAIRQCAPYRMPARFAPYYEDWREVKAEFDFAGR